MFVSEMGREIKLFLLFIILEISLIRGEIIYWINGTEHERLPPITLLDNYEECMHDLDPLYCTTELEVIADEPNDLLDLIKNYSEWKLKHYNYSHLYRGICVTRTCKISKEDALQDRYNVLEGCLNITLYKKYKLKSRLLSSPECYPTDKNIEVEATDIFVAAICLFIIILNLAATFYDLYSKEKSHSKGAELFLAFSISRNWTNLHNSDNRTKPAVGRLKGLDGLRALMMLFLVMGHSVLPVTISVRNTRFIEEAYYSYPYHMLINMMYIVQYFFIMSGCLLGYNMERSSEKRKLNWTSIPSNIIKRWLRFTPSYAIIIAITSTWLRFMGSGPYGRYLAADMHLYCAGVILLVLTANNGWRNVALLTTLLIGIITPAIPTYIHNLETFLTFSPEGLRNYAVNEQTNDYLYKCSHTNIANFTIGMITGICLHHLQKNQFDVKKYKKYIILYWATIPLGIAIIVFNKVFYDDGPQVPLLLRVLYQMFARPVMALLFVILVTGMVFKFENIYRGIFEWSGWAWLARIAYSSYISHLTVIRWIFGNSIFLLEVSPLTGIYILGLAVIAILFAVVYWLLLEAPMNRIVDICFESTNKEDKDIMVNKKD